MNVLFGSMHLFIHPTVHDSLSHCLCCAQPGLDLRYLSNVYENTKSSVHGRAASSQGYMVVYPGLASPCVFSLGLMTAAMFTYTQRCQKGEKTKTNRQGFPVKPLQRLEQDSIQHIRTCPGHTQHSIYQAIHSVHVCTRCVVSYSHNQLPSKGNADNEEDERGAGGV